MSSSIFASEFLKIVPEARSTGMGCVNNGISEGTASLYLNPAGLTTIRNHEFLFSHLFWPLKGLDFTDDFFIQYEYFSFAGRLRKSSFGISLSHYHQPPFEYENASYSIYSGFSSFTYAYDLYNFQVGVRTRIIWEVLGEYKGYAFSLDFGIIQSYNFLKFYKGSTPNFQTGLTVNNIGTSMVLYSEEEPLPFNIQTGYSYTFFKTYKGSLLFANDYKYFFGYNNMYRLLEINSGMEYTFRQLISLRAGHIFSMPVNEPEFSNFQNSKFTCGAGAKYKIFSFELQLNYSYITPLTSVEYNTHALSITFRKTRYIEKFVE